MSPQLHINRAAGAAIGILNVIEEAKNVLAENQASGLAGTLTDADMVAMFGEYRMVMKKTRRWSGCYRVQFNAVIYSLGQIVTAAEPHAPSTLQNPSLK